MRARPRPHALRWYAAVVVIGVAAILLIGALIIQNLLSDALRGAPGSQLHVLRVLGPLILATAVLLLGLFLWIQRRLLHDLESLVRGVEEAGPEFPKEEDLPPLRIREFERLRRAFLRLFERFTASRARQQEVEGTLGYVLDHAADAVLVLDRANRVVSWNRGAEETFGFPSEEILDSPYTLLVPSGVEEPELQTPLEPGSTVKDLRTRRLRRDGSLLEVSLTRSRIPATGGDEERFVEIIRDVTKTRRLEEDLLRTEKMAAVGKISSKVVHEIRNPLASINLNVDLLRESLESSPGGLADPEGREILGIIKREVRRLSQITEEYLQFSRLPRAAFRRERVNDILVELSDFMRPSIARKGVRLVLNLDETDPEAICDATLLRQALLNLLRNAVDASAEGKGQIQMRTRVLKGEAGEREDPRAGELSGPGEAVEITVEDNGRGIPEDQLPRIFEPFYTTKTDGTGLGLALVHRAVEEHGGEISCHSVPGRGTTFRVIVPSRPSTEGVERAGGAVSIPLRPLRESEPGGEARPEPGEGTSS